MRETLFDHCVRTNDSKLVKQWDADRNAPLTPQSVSYGSKKKFGGTVNADISGRLLLQREPVEDPVAHTVPEQKRCLGRPICLLVIRIWRLNGIR